jgi:hypothetical protein
MAASLRALRTRLRLQPEADPGYFDHPMALPVLALPHWVAPAGTPWPRVHAAAVSAAFGYLHVRVHDDLLDEGEGGADALMLANLLLHAHRSTLAEAAGGDPDFADHADRVWASYAEAMALEAALRDGGATWSVETAESALDRSMPLALPAAALLSSAEERARLAAVVRPLVRGHQLINDLVDVERDLGAGNRSMVTARAGADADAAGVRAWLFGGGGLDAVVADALADFEACAVGARRLAAEPLAAYVQARMDHARSVQQRAWRTYLEHTLGGARA